MSYEKEDISYPCSATNAKARAREKENQESKNTNTHTYHELVHLAMHVRAGMLKHLAQHRDPLILLSLAQKG